MRHKALILAFASLSGIAFSQTSGTPTSSLQAAAPAIDGILAAFQKAPLVGLGDWHGLAQEEDFYVSLVSDPRFATNVGNVVVEFGNASQQKVIDRYVDGEDIPYTELRKVWADTSYVGWFPTVTALGYLNFYAAIRAANAKLPAKSHIHIWLGGEPVDWSNIKTKQDLSKVVGDQPDRYPADLIEKEVLSKGKRRSSSTEHSISMTKDHSRNGSVSDIPGPCSSSLRTRASQIDPARRSLSPCSRAGRCQR